MFDLRTWLRRSPKPFKLAIKTADGESKEILLGKGRTRWHATEETVRTSGAISIQCLAEDGTILRAQRLSDEDIEADPEEARETSALGIDKTSSKAFQAQAMMLDRYGMRLTEAFAAGAAAASSSQDKLVELVENLTGHLTLAITNLHTLSANYANQLQAMGSGSGESENPNTALMMNMVAGLLAKGGAAAPAPAAANGKSK
jgi:hypothetical protein